VVPALAAVFKGGSAGVQEVAAGALRDLGGYGSNEEVKAQVAAAGAVPALVGVLKGAEGGGGGAGQPGLLER
jgi:hypothetical protein